MVELVEMVVCSVWCGEDLGWVVMYVVVREWNYWIGWVGVVIFICGI